MEDRSIDSVPAGSPRRRRLRWALVGGAGLLGLAIAAFLVAALGFSGADLSGGELTSLAGLDVQALGGSVVSVSATGPGGREIPVVLHGDRIMPKGRLAQGETVEVSVVVHRPAAIGWLAGSEDRETVTVHTPVARIDGRWLTVKAKSDPRVAFDRPVRAVAYGSPGKLKHRHLQRARGSVSLGGRPPAGSVVVAAAVAPWEKLGRFHTVTWFPDGGSAAVAASPTAGSEVAPSKALRLTFSRPVAKVLGDSEPRLSPQVPGHWTRPDRHTIVFHPSGFGAPMATTLKAELPESVEVVQSDGSTESAEQVEWKVPAGSTLRLQQLLAEAGYLPVSWKPSGEAVGKTPEDEVEAAVEPPSGEFSWRYHHTPAALRELWSPGEEDVVTKGALMSFEDDHEMEADGIAGPAAWEALMKAAIGRETKAESGYSYVYVTESLPEQVTVWHNGHDVVEGAGNTGIPGAETELGTFPVFEHLEETTMEGENPDGSKYVDPGIMWVSYFNGGDALHAFDRASYGSPQSLGCVEMPLAEAGEVWPYTPIGTLVTVAS